MGVLIFIFQLASPVAITESIVLLHDTLTNIFSAGSAQPQSVAVDCCCKTIWLVMTDGKRILLHAALMKNRIGIRTTKEIFLIILHYIRMGSYCYESNF